MTVSYIEATCCFAALVASALECRAPPSFLGARVRHGCGIRRGRQGGPEFLLCPAASQHRGDLVRQRRNTAPRPLITLPFHFLELERSTVRKWNEGWKGAACGGPVRPGRSLAGCLRSRPG